FVNSSGIIEFHLAVFYYKSNYFIVIASKIVNMSILKVNLTNCNLEPIHIPGKIQSHGFLLATDKNGIIRFQSENSNDFIPGTYPQLLKQSIQNIGSVIDTSGKVNWIHILEQNFTDINPVSLDIRNESFNLIISHFGGYILFEFERAGAITTRHEAKLITKSIPIILKESSLQSLLAATSQEVKRIINYDRVMIYQFADDGHGEIVAEAKKPDLESWLGLHYPASDIPQQARELYKLNLTRLISNVYDEPVGIASQKGEPSDLDLTSSHLRAVSPIHIQYLKNMGVSSSFSISLIYKKELWGLIACHNYTPRFINYESREAAKIVGQVLSAALEIRQDAQDLQLLSSFYSKVDELSINLHSANLIEEALFDVQSNILSVVQATGAALIYDKKISTAGTVPEIEDIKQLVTWISENSSEDFYASSHVGKAFPQAASYKELACGILSVTLSKELNEYIIWFKPEIIKNINWAGNPDKPVAEDEMLKLSPRNSFEKWVQKVSGTSQPWATEEIKSALRLRTKVLGVISAKASAIRTLNDRLKNAYEELDTFSYTISHDLKTPITAIKAYAQLLEYDNDINTENKNLIQRIINRTDRMNDMINEVFEYSRIGRQTVRHQSANMGNILKEIVQDLGEAYPSVKPGIIIGDTPTLKGDPMMIWQVFNNVIGNAVKYSQHAPNPSIVIEGKVMENQIIYTIKDNGIGIPHRDINNIFLLFRRMGNTGDIEGSGVGLAIAKKIVEKHEGHIWVESEEGSGSTFFLAFNLR
ncbi:MAG: ATP-binding protein, partial [Ginsengibacter sp.]